MRGMLSLLMGLILACAFVARADEPRPIPVPQALPQPVPKDAPAQKPGLSVEHLLKAAEHLEAAGLTDEAIKLRSIARQRALHDSDLSRKEAELECLQEEVDRLRELTGQSPGVVIEIVALEVHRGRLGLKAQEFDRMVGLGPISRDVAGPRDTSHSASTTADERSAFQNPAVVEANPARLPIFKELREKGVISILAEPTLVTTSKRPVSFLDGGQIPIPVPATGGGSAISYKNFGMQVEVVASVLANQHLRLQTLLELSQKNLDDSVVVEGHTVPGITTRRINTEVEMRLGQTLTIGRLVAPRRAEAAASDRKVAAKSTGPDVSPAESVEMLVFITPRLLHEPIVPHASSIIPTAAADDLGAVVPAEGTLFGPTVPVLKRRPVRK